VKALIYISIACGLGVGWTTPALSQTDSSLEEIVVTARSLEEELPQQLSQYGTHVDVVSAAQIQNAGLYVSPNSGPFDYVQISLQGSRTEDVLWMVDGIRINNRLYAGTTPLDTIPSGIVERIEVLDGGQALFYGTQAVAGAVNIVTKAYSDHPDGSISVGGDSNNGRQAQGFYRDTIGNNHFVVYALHDQSTGIEPFPEADYQPSGTDRHRSYKVTTVGGKDEYDFTDALSLNVSYLHTNANLDFEQPMLTENAYNQRNEDLLSSRLDFTPSDEFKLYIKDYYHWWLSHFTEFDNGSTPYVYTPGYPGQISVAEYHGFWGYRDYGVNLLTQIAVNRGFEYLAGYDLQNYTGRDVVLVIQRETQHVNAFFGQIRTTPDLIPDAHLAVGVRYNIPSFGESALVWNASGKYDFTSNLFFKATGGTAFRLPTDEELFANDPEDELGDPSLKPETSTFANVSLGGVATLGIVPLEWELIGFYRDIKNLIDFQSFDTDTNQDVFGNAPGNVITKGAEVTLSAHITADVSANFDATYNHARETGSDLQFDQVPVALFKAGLDYHPKAVPVGATVSVVHMGDIDDEPFGAGNGRFGYGNYTVVDLGARVFLDSARHQRIDLHLNNAFDMPYYSALSHGVNDTTGNPYVAHDLGLRRTFSAYYTCSF
jgi:outer membrane cobalamin receptor